MTKLVSTPTAASSRAAIAVALLALAGALVLAGCGKKKRAAAAPPAATAGSAAPTPTPPPTPTAPPVIAVGDGTGVPACDQFLAVLGKAIACEQLATARTALEANLANQKRRFAGWPALSAAARTAAMTEAAPQCKGGVDGIRTTMASAGCAP